MPTVPGSGVTVGGGGGGGGGVSDHGALTGLADDDHPQYLTAAEGNAAYQPLDSDLTSIAALTTTAAGRGVLTKSAGTEPTTINEVVDLLQAWGISA